jgi:hypothetical protein
MFEKSDVSFDIEMYRNYFLVGFQDVVTREYKQFEVKKSSGVLTKKQITEIKNIISKNRLIGFNCIKYDTPILLLALKGRDVRYLYDASTLIIKENYSIYRTSQLYDLDQQLKQINQVDLSTIDIARGAFISLKQYGARINAPTIQDLPIKWDSKLSKDEMKEIKTYNRNDLDLTTQLYEYGKANIELREFLSEKYGVDLTSSQGAKIAETIISSEFAKRGKYLKRSGLEAGEEIRYKAPKHIKFRNKSLKELLKNFKETPLIISESGNIIKPDFLNDPTTINKTSYTVGLGGLHAIIKNKGIVPKKDEVLNQPDVGSYYPSMILAYGFKAKGMGDLFDTIYKGLVEDRFKWKELDSKLKHLKNDEWKTAMLNNNGLKLVLNALFGTYGNKWFKTYAPDLLIQITITGQLNLLMLIEWLEDAGIKVKSANTDSVLILHKKKDSKKAKKILKKWEKVTSMSLEDDYIDAFFARDINSYMYTKKGSYDGIAYFKKFKDVSKNLEYPIVYKAIGDFISKDIPIEETISECNDITEFISTRKSTTGATYKGKLIGKALRFYYCNDDDALFNIITNEKIENYNERYSIYEEKLKTYNDEVSKWEEALLKWKETKEGKRPLKPKKIYPPTKPRETKVSKSDFAYPCLKLPHDMPENLDREFYVKLAYKHVKEIGWTKKLQKRIIKNAQKK